MCNYGFARCVAISTAKELCNLGSNVAMWMWNVEGKAINQGSNVNVEGKDEVEMQTPINDSGIFTEESRSTQPSP